MWDRRTSLTKGSEEVGTPMHSSAERPLPTTLGILLWLLSTGVIWHGVRYLVSGLCEIDHPTGALWAVRAGHRGAWA
jgi:hypothetical protein